MDNKQVCDAIYGCVRKLTHLNYRMSRLYADQSAVCNVRTLVNNFYHANKEHVTEKSACIQISNEFTQEQYILKANKIKVNIHMRAYKPLCMRTTVPYSGSTYPVFNKHTDNFKCSLTKEVSEEYNLLNLEKLSRDFMFLYREGYLFDCDTDNMYSSTVFESHRNKTSVGIIVEAI